MDFHEDGAPEVDKIAPGGGDDGVRYYGSHLSVVSAGLKKGVRVKAGQQVGKVGRAGNASNVCHVHYGISPPCKKSGDWKVRRGVVWPAVTTQQPGGRAAARCPAHAAVWSGTARSSAGQAGRTPL